MSSKRHTQEQTIRVLKEIDVGASMAGVAPEHGIGVQTIYAWRKRFAGMGASELAEFKILQSENARLKRIVANQAMDIECCKELQKGKW
mgnify:CR=1 FL=1